jgi:hypothetical protein
MDKKNKVLLYKSFDSELNQDEKIILNKALSESEELRNEKEMIISIRKNVEKSKTTSFNPNFADQIMEKIQPSILPDESDRFFESLSVVFRPIAIAATILIIIIAGYNMSTTDNYSLEGALGVPEVTVNDAYDPSIALVTEDENAD